MSKHILAVIACLILIFSGDAQEGRVRINNSGSSLDLMVDDEPFIVNGMNWDYYPIGTNYNYSLWNQDDSIIRAALDSEMTLLQEMGVNTIRQYTGVPPRWITYIYETYGIYTILNHSFGRYGLTLGGRSIPNTDYDDAVTRKFLLEEVRILAQSYRETPGLLMYLLGNENNYGLFWSGAETEDFPDDAEEKRHVGEVRARPMYRLMNEAALLMKSIDKDHLVAICNGDVLFLDILAEECPDIDVYGTNTYRGESFGDLFDEVKQHYGKPVLLTEFGVDAFNAITQIEDQQAQAYYVVCNWMEIYQNSAALKSDGNSIGGLTFQFSDGWWKYGQTKNLEVHDKEASWANGGYGHDFVKGQNNMNEEWFGVCAKEPPNSKGLYALKPRAAFYALKEAHGFDPYKEGETPKSLQNYFKNILEREVHNFKLVKN